MNKIDEAVKVLDQGGIIIYPTDTAFGIGCKVNDEEAIRKLFEIRRRPFSQATPVLFDSIERVKDFVLPINEKIEFLMNKYWPGALTIVIPSQVSKIPSLVRGDGPNLGVRVPDHEVPRALVEGLGLPILGPSANFHGENTPYKFEDLDKSLIKLVDLVIEGKTHGENLASTVVDCSEEPWRILRQGSLKIDL